jgi:pimeloyl-ACP methyl ester carboxylesterase
MSVITISHEIVHYEVLGRGRPLFFLHGWVGSWRYWIPAMQATSTAFRAYALDLWGFGDTAKSLSKYTLPEQVNLLERFLEEMAIFKIALVGHGLGAMVAALFARRNPEAVDRLMGVCFPLTIGDINARLNSASPAELAGWLLSRAPGTEPAQAEAPKAAPQAISASLQDLASLDLRQICATLETPYLLVYGQNDPAVSLPSLNGESELPRSAHHIVFEDSGHFPMLDEPAKFNRLLADFLALESGASPRQLQLKEEWKRRVR